MELTPYSKEGHRPLSRFHAEEMLYEFAQGTLDPVRAKAMEDYLKTDSEMQKELRQIRKGLGYLDQLSTIPVASENLSQVRETTHWTDQVSGFLKMDQWPAGLRLGVESLAVVSAIFVIAVAIPWNSLFEVIQDESGTVTLAEVHKDGTPNVPMDDSKDGVMDAVKGIVFEDEGVPEADKKAAAVAAAAAAKIIAAHSAAPAPSPKAAVVSPSVENPAQKRMASSVAPPVVAANTAPVPAKPTVNPETARVAAAKAVGKDSATKGTERTTASEPGATRGFLYRGTLATTNVEATTPKLVEILSQLGGRKAGQVALGWRKGQGSYFHFTIPEAKYEELEKLLREYGTLVISKEKHDRVMPEGIIRLIIEVGEKNP